MYVLLQQNKLDLGTILLSLNFNLCDKQSSIDQTSSKNRRVTISGLTLSLVNLYLLTQTTELLND